MDVRDNYDWTLWELTDEKNECHGVRVMYEGVKGYITRRLSDSRFMVVLPSGLHIVSLKDERLQRA